MKFEKIFETVLITGRIEHKSQEDMLKYEIYKLMERLLQCLHAFETGSRKAMRLTDQYELLGELKADYDWLKGNIKCLEDLRRGVNNRTFSTNAKRII